MAAAKKKASKPAPTKAKPEHMAKKAKATAEVLASNLERTSKKRRMLIIDADKTIGYTIGGAMVTANPETEKKLSSLPNQVAFQQLMVQLERLRIEYRVEDLIDLEPISEHGTLQELTEQLLRCPVAIIPDVTREVYSKVALACMHAWAMKTILGPVTDLSLEKQANKIEKLAEWRERAGDENAAQIQARADAIRTFTPEELYKQFELATKKDYSPMAKLPSSQQIALEKIIANGGTITAEAAKEVHIPEGVMKTLVIKKLVEQTPEGLFRVMPSPEIVKEKTAEEKAATKAAAKGPKAEKTAKAKKEPKEKKVRPPKVLVNPTELCLCGCGAKVPGTSRFAPGHDAKLHSLVLKTVKAEGDKGKLAELAKATPAVLLPKGEVGKLQTAYLQNAPWMDASLKKAIGV